MGWTQRELGALAGLSAPEVCSAERGYCTWPSWRARIALALGMPGREDWLFNEISGDEAEDLRMVLEQRRVKAPA
jgi:transcriptional regulator with XRE-family HTH domain